MPLGDGQPGMHVLMLTLQTGETVALLGSHSRGAQVNLIADGHAEPAVVIEHFADATGFPADRITPIREMSGGGE